MFSDRPLRTTESNVRSSGGPGSVLTGTQASSGKSRMVSARFHASPPSVLRRRIGVQPIPPKQPLWVPPFPTKWHLRVLRLPPKALLEGATEPLDAIKGSAGPLKTTTSKDDLSSSRCSPAKARVDGGLVDVEGFSHPRYSTPSSRPHVPPKPVALDRLKKAEQNLVLLNQFSALSDDEMDLSPVSPD